MATQITGVVLNNIYSFLDSDDILNSAFVCKTWNENALLKQARDRIKRETVLEYPIELRRVLQENNTPIGRLPVFDLTPLWKSRDYIDFLKSKDMTHPVMRFKDPLGRPGVVLHIREKKGNSSLPFVIFQRYIGDKDKWLYAYDQHDLNNSHMGREYEANWHAEMPSNGDALAKISKLLAGKDPKFYVHLPKNRCLSAKNILITSVAVAILACVIYQLS